jgi:HlyD family secretion protein
MFSVILRYTTILGAVAGVAAMAAVMRKQGDNELPQADTPPVAPAAKPFLHAVAATGILEALSENVAVGVPAPGLVMEVMVKVNDAIEAGQPLFRLDDRELQAEKTNQQAQLEVARAELAVREAFVEKAKRLLDRLESLGDSQAISREQLDAAQDDMAIAKAQFAAARSQVTAAEAAVARLDTLIGRLTMKAPRAGTVLQVNIRAGEYAATSPKSPAMVIGDTGKLQVRGHRRAERHPHPSRPESRGHLERRPAGLDAARIHPRGALHHPEGLSNRRQHRTRRHPRAPGHVLPAKAGRYPGLRRPAGRCPDRGPRTLSLSQLLRQRMLRPLRAAGF